MKYITLNIERSDTFPLKLSLQGYSLYGLNNDGTPIVINDPANEQYLRGLVDNLKNTALTIDKYPASHIFNLMHYTGRDITQVIQSLWFATYYNRLIRLGHTITIPTGVPMIRLLDNIAIAHANTVRQAKG